MIQYALPASGTRPRDQQVGIVGALVVSSAPLVHSQLLSLVNTGLPGAGSRAASGAHSFR
jgi:hypothetical protein